MTGSNILLCEKICHAIYTARLHSLLQCITPSATRWFPPYGPDGAAPCCLTPRSCHWSCFNTDTDSRRCSSGHCLCLIFYNNNNPELHQRSGRGDETERNLVKTFPTSVEPRVSSSQEHGLHFSRLQTTPLVLLIFDEDHDLMKC